MQLPSTSNTVGSLAGLVAGLVANQLTSAGVIASIAVFTTFPPATVTMLITAGVATIVNYGVTHYATVKNWDNLVKEIPKTYAEYPGDKSTTPSSNNLQRPV